MDLTFTVAKGSSTNPFNVLDQDTNDVIEVINYLIKHGEVSKEEQQTQQMQKLENKLPDKKNGRDIIWDYI